MQTMPRPRRILLAHQPHHIVQRGHRRQVVFERAVDYRTYLHDLQYHAAQLSVALHAWCLMPNHVHLLLTPAADPDSLSTLMQHLAGGATRRWNARKQTTGSIWEARFKSRVIDEERYLLECCRYIELNPVRAQIVAAAENYPWSSYRERMGMAPATMLDLHMLYLAMGNDDAARRDAYGIYVHAGIASGPI
ncbi:transposase [Bordetella sp. BOR01]|uniref:REP-associated tyrosine transposase n=1 Tax=Bordetella sp. BOR01 TaxID=2854779 RepID=UPI001C4738A3|nr:transposase [Bordetella sp. BOR01]MBV7483988.1 transposase [Bordetella sp. BOR01]